MIKENKKLKEIEELGLLRKLKYIDKLQFKKLDIKKLLKLSQLLTII